MIFKLRTFILIAALTICLAVPSFAATPYHRTVSLTGNTITSVYALMVANGWTGRSQMMEVTILNSGAATIYVGQSDCSAANGFPIAAGGSITERASGLDRANNVQDNVPAATIYLFVASTQNVSIAARAL